MSERPTGKRLGDISARRVDGKSAPAETNHYIRCQLCAGFMDPADLRSVLAHETPLPHPTKDQEQ